MPAYRLLPAFAVLAYLAVSPAMAANAVLPENGRIEFVIRTGGPPPDDELRYTCERADQKLTCTAHTFDPPAPGSVDTEYRLVGDLTSNPIAFEAYAKMTTRAPTCALSVIEFNGRGEIIFNPDGTLRFSGGVTDARFTVVQGCPTVQVGGAFQVPAHVFPGNWHVLGVAPEQAGFGDAQTRASLWKQLGQAEGPLARKCFDEAFAKLNEPRNAEIKERIDAAAYQQHVVEASAAAADADDFDPQWLEAAKKIGGTGDAKQRFVDKLVKLLPGPFGTLVSLSQKAYRLSIGINEKVVLSKLKGRLYDAYKNERAARPNDPPAEVLKDASAAAGGWEKTKTDLIKSFPGANDNARERAMTDYIAARFDFIYRAREMSANKEQEVAKAWANASNDVARVRMTVLDCMAK